MSKYKVNVNFVKDGVHHFSGDVLELPEKEAKDWIKKGREIHPTLGDFLSPVDEEKVQPKKETKPKK